MPDMMRLQVLALAVVGCATPITAPDVNATSDPLCHDAPPVVCSDVLPGLVTWNPLKGPAPIPAFHSNAGVVVVFPTLEDPATEWAFAVDGGAITGWIAFPGSGVGRLVTQLTTSGAQLGAVTRAAGLTPQLAIIKPPVPTPPRLAAYVRQVAAYHAAASATAEADVADACQ
jgi:hypothetical protein